MWSYILWRVVGGRFPTRGPVPMAVLVVEVPIVSSPLPLSFFSFLLWNPSPPLSFRGAALFIVLVVRGPWVINDHAGGGDHAPPL